MPEYRVYQITSEGRITEPPWVMEADTDEQAVSAARRYLDGEVLEVWNGARLAGRIDPK